MKTIALDENSNGQVARADPQPADLLGRCTARCDRLEWNPASWLASQRDEALCEEITKRTGIAATSAILSLNQILRDIASSDWGS